MLTTSSGPSLETLAMPSAWPDIPAELSIRWDLEIADLLACLKKEKPATGDSEAVLLSESFVKAEKTASWARLEIGQEGVSYFVGTREIDRKPVFELGRKDMFSFADSYAYNRPVILNLKELTRELPLPKIVEGVEEEHYEGDISSVERKLFPMLRQIGTLVMVDPSFSSLSRSAKERETYVFFSPTCSLSENRKARVRDFMARSNGRVIELFDEIPLGVYYMGTSRIVWKPSNGKWISMIPNPYDLPPTSLGYSLEEVSTGVKMVFCQQEKKQGSVNFERKWVAFLPDSVKTGFLYNPKTVAKWLEIEDSVYFMGSGYPLITMTDHVETIDCPHTPWYVDEFPDWTFLGPMVCRVKYNVVYDVKGPGTYLTRRSKTELPKGYVWADLQKTHGVAFVTRFTNELQQCVDVQSVQLMGDSYTYLGNEPIDLISSTRIGPGFFLPTSVSFVEEDSDLIWGRGYVDKDRGLRPRKWRKADQDSAVEEVVTTQGRIPMRLGGPINEYDPISNHLILPDSWKVGTLIDMPRTDLPIDISKIVFQAVSYYWDGAVMRFVIPQHCRGPGRFLLKVRTDLQKMNLRLYRRVLNAGRLGYVHRQDDESRICMTVRLQTDTIHDYLARRPNVPSWDSEGYTTRNILSQTFELMSSTQANTTLSGISNVVLWKYHWNPILWSWAMESSLTVFIPILINGEIEEVVLGDLMKEIRTGNSRILKFSTEYENLSDFFDLLAMNNFTLFVRERNLVSITVSIEYRLLKDFFFSN
jgi:hypothetical protein